MTVALHGSSNLKTTPEPVWVRMQISWNRPACLVGAENRTVAEAEVWQLPSEAVRDLPQDQ